MLLSQKDKKEIMEWVREILGPITKFKLVGYDEYGNLSNTLVYWTAFACTTHDYLDLLDIVKRCLHEKIKQNG